MRRKHGHNFYLAQCGQSLISAHARIPDSEQCPAEGASKRRLFRIEFPSSPPALTMVGLRQIGEFEIDRERLRHSVCLVNAQPFDNAAGFVHFLTTGLRARRMCARLDEQPPKLLHSFEERLACLSRQNPAKQDAK